MSDENQAPFDANRWIRENYAAHHPVDTSERPPFRINRWALFRWWCFERWIWIGAHLFQVNFNLDDY